MNDDDPRGRPRSRNRRIALSGLSACMLSACAEPFFFHPNRQTYTPRARLGTAAEDVFFDSAGARLHGWWLPASDPALATVVHCHGNAANVSNHAPQVAWLPAEGCNVLTFDYRGFGHSEGAPSLQGVVDDARAAIAEARARRPGLPIVLLGQSLGGATAIRAAAGETQDDIRLVIVDSAFASYRGIVRDATHKTVLMFLAPLASATLPRKARDPLTAIAGLRVPLLILHGDRDRVIPIRHGERLHAAATAAPVRQFVRIPGGDHLDALRRDDVRRLVRAAIVDACHPVR